MKVSKLEGAELDYWVAKTEKYTPILVSQTTAVTLGMQLPPKGKELCYLVRTRSKSKKYQPSSDWQQGGPIIERERIQLRPCVGSTDWDAFHLKGKYRYSERMIGPTPLIAAMRVYVASKLGNETNMEET